MADTNKIEVTGAFERVVHWVLAISCLVLLFTGLGLLFKSWTVITGIFGGTLNLKIVHDVVAWVFMVSLPFAFIVWVKDCFNFFTSEDMKWYSKVGGYLTRETVHFNLGKFNPGQKIFWWWVIIGGVLMSITGLALMYPGSVSPQTVLLAGALHVLVMITLALFILVHIYLGTIGNPGSVSSIFSGRVTRKWAKTHRPAWLKEHPDGL